MRLITKRMEVVVEVEGVKIKGQALTTSEQAEIRQKSFVVVTLPSVDAETGEETTTEKTVFSNGLYSRDLFIKTIVGLDENAVDENGKRLECNEEDLGKIFDFNEGFCLEAVKKINAAFLDIRKGELKNSKTGVTGTLPQVEPTATSAVN